MNMTIPLPEPLNMLIGGLKSRSLTNFYGGPGTGKTNICLISALRCARLGGEVIYVDSEGGFSLERVKQIEPEDYNVLLKKIKLVEPSTFEEQGRIIRHLSKQHADMIIVDSMVALYRIEYSETRNGELKRLNTQIMEANRELSRQLSILSNIAREKNIPVVITAHVFSNWDTGEEEIIGGEVIKYWSKVMVLLERTGKMSERKATITKHRYMPEGKSAKFIIVDEGIKPAGFRIF